MNAYVFQSEREEEIEQTMQLLRDKHQVTGEYHIKPRGDGGWRLTVYSEQAIKASILTKLPAEAVDLADRA